MTCNIFLIIFLSLALALLFYWYEIKKEPEWVQYISIEYEELDTSLSDFPLIQESIRTRLGSLINTGSSILEFHLLKPQLSLDEIEILHLQQTLTCSDIDQISKVPHDEMVANQGKFGFCWAFAAAGQIRAARLRIKTSKSPPPERIIVGSLLVLTQRDKYLRTSDGALIREPRDINGHGFRIDYLLEVSHLFRLVSVIVDRDWFEWVPFSSLWGSQSWEKKAEQVLSAKRTLVGRFCLGEEGWKKFYRMWWARSPTIVWDDLQEVSSSRTCHAVLIVGFDAERKVFLVKNSWGKNGGCKGYVLLSYAFFDPKNYGQLIDTYWTVDMLLSHERLQ